MRGTMLNVSLDDCDARECVRVKHATCPPWSELQAYACAPIRAAAAAKRLLLPLPRTWLPCVCSECCAHSHNARVRPALSLDQITPTSSTQPPPPHTGVQGRAASALMRLL